MSPPKTWFLLPNNDIPADGPMVLGSIIPDLLDPTYILNVGDTVPVDREYTTYTRDLNHSVKSSGGGSVGLLATFLSSWLGGNFGASFNTTTTTHYRIQNVETKFFIPTPEYIEKAVSSARVLLYLKGSRYKSPLYIITGVKLTRGPNSFVISGRSAGHEGRTNVGIPGITPGSGNFDSWQSNSEDSSFAGGSDFVIGYRLGKISFQKISGQDPIPSQQRHIEGAMLGAHSEKPMDNKGQTLPATVLFEGEDAVMEDLSENDLLAVIDEEDGTNCQCFRVVLPRE
jgi:hypothetical protein